MAANTDHAPLTPEEEARWRDYIGAAGRGVEFVKGGVFDMTARILATLDAERAARGGLDREHASEAHYAQTVDCGDRTCPLNWKRLTTDPAP